RSAAGNAARSEDHVRGQEDVKMMESGLVPEGLPGKLTATALTLPEDLTYERWASIGQTLQQLERSVGFWLGDWWNYGERRWGELSAQAVKEMTGHERPTIWNYG